MEQTVYIDLYFLINFSMDFLCFFLVAKLLSYPFSLPGSALASVFGGVYACCALFFVPDGVFGIILDLGICVLMSFIAVKKKGNLGQTWIFALVYGAASIVLGGFMTVLFSLFNRMGVDKLFGNENSSSDGISVWLFALLAIISGVCSMLGGKFFRRKSARYEGRVRVTFGQNQIIIKALCDSGNLLREPISGKLCIVVDKDKLEKILPPEIKRIISGNMLKNEEEKYLKSIRIMPVATANGDGMMYALRADRLEINMGKGWSVVDAFVVLGGIGKSANGAYALVPSELIAAVP